MKKNKILYDILLCPYFDGQNKRNETLPCYNLFFSTWLYTNLKTCKLRLHSDIETKTNIHRGI